MRTDKEIRCSSPAISYGRVLFGLDVPEETVSKTREILKEVPQLADIFMNPTISLRKKYSVIDKVFPEEMRNFLKTGMIHAILSCVTPPGEEQKKGIEEFLCRKYKAEEAKIQVCRDDSLIGGFLLRVGSDEYDWSIKGRMDRLYDTLTGR